MRTLVGEVDRCGGRPWRTPPLVHPWSTPAGPPPPLEAPNASLRHLGSMAVSLAPRSPQTRGSPIPPPHPPRVEGRCHVSPFPRPSSQDSSEHPPQPLRGYTSHSAASA